MAVAHKSDNHSVMEIRILFIFFESSVDFCRMDIWAGNEFMIKDVLALE